MEYTRDIITPEESLENFKNRLETDLATWFTNRDVELQKSLVIRTREVFFIMKRAGLSYKTTFVQYLDTKLDLVVILCDAFLQSSQPHNDTVCQTALSTLGNVSHSSSSWSTASCQYPDFLSRLKELLEEHKDVDLSTCEATLKQLLVRILLFLHNATMVNSNITLLQGLHLAASLRPYLDSANENVKLDAFFVLADIIQENESHFVDADTEVIQFLLEKFTEAINNQETKKALGKEKNSWTASELCKGVESLSKNDGNKKTLVDAGFLPPLVLMAKSTDIHEQTLALKAIWSLSFDEANHHSIIHEPDLIHFTQLNKDCDNPKLRRVCQGILWTLRNALVKDIEYQQLGDSLIRGPEKDERQRKVSGQGHIMISYQWDHQELLKKIRDRLMHVQQKVWMDIYQMEGSILEGMASAVEGADLILICISRKYKNSLNCRREAEYACTLNKPIIPLMLESQYKPDGWLGLLLGAKLYYDFSNSLIFEQKTIELLNAVQKQLNRLESSLIKEKITPARDMDTDHKPIVTPGVSKTVISTTSPPPVTRREILTDEAVEPLTDLSTWSREETQIWFKRYGVSGQMIKHLCGKDLVVLLELRTKAPAQYYQTLRDDLNLKFFKWSNFNQAIDDLNS